VEHQDFHWASQTSFHEQIAAIAPYLIANARVRGQPSSGRIEFSTI
jgi:hypothetical protein